MVSNGQVIAAGAGMGNATFKLSADDLVEANQAAYRAGLRSWRGLLWAASGVVFLTVSVTAIMLGTSSAPWQTTALATVLSVVTFVIILQILNYHVFLPAAAARQFAITRAAQGDIEVRWTPDELAVTTDVGNQRWRWPEYARYLDTARLLLLQPRSGVGLTILPKAAIGSEGDAAIRAALAGAGVRPAGFRNA